MYMLIAAIVTHVFTGAVSVSTLSGVNVGDSFTGTLSYDTAQAPVQSGPGESQYINYTFTLRADGLAWTQGGLLAVFNDQWYGDAFFINGADTGQAGFGLTDSTGRALSSTALPLALDLSQFDSATVAIGGYPVHWIGNITQIVSTVQQTPAQQVAALQAQVASQALSAKLSAAAAALARGDDAAAAGELGAFENAVAAQRGKAIAVADAQAWLAAADAILESL